MDNFETVEANVGHAAAMAYFYYHTKSAPTKVEDIEVGDMWCNGRHVLTVTKVGGGNNRGVHIECVERDPVQQASFIWFLEDRRCIGKDGVLFVGGTCAACEQQPPPPDDYLCEGCRGRE